MTETRLSGIRLEPPFTEARFIECEISHYPTHTQILNRQPKLNTKLQPLVEDIPKPLILQILLQ